MSHWDDKTETTPTRIRFSCLVWVLFLGSLVGGCTQDVLTPRLPAYLKIEAGPSTPGIELQNRIPMDIGLLSISDSSVPGLAPAIPDSMLSILDNRASRFLKKNLSLNAIPLTRESTFSKDRGLIGLQKTAQANGLPFFLVALFSSVESETATHLGAHPIMTQMPGLTIENIALAELALVHSESRSVVFHVNGRSSMSMDELTVPLGSDTSESGTEARTILRANAAQSALDLALIAFREKWNQFS